MSNITLQKPGLSITPRIKVAPFAIAASIQAIRLILGVGIAISTILIVSGGGNIDWTPS